MSGVFSTFTGESPLLISVPHDGRAVPDEIRARMTPAGRAVPDTDWHVAQLYGFARDIGASIQVANYSRYVVDLNRSATDDVLYPGRLATGLCPDKTFSGDDIYVDTGVTSADKAARISTYWRPYHAQLESTLAAIRQKHGYALLWDAHSIPSVLPRLFDGELPELNIGTNDGKSCAPSIEAAVVKAASGSPYSIAVNERFKGGYITRHYGDPDGSVSAIQLEIAQRTYMDETSRAFDRDKADRLRTTLGHLLRAVLSAAGSRPMC